MIVAAEAPAAVEAVDTKKMIVGALAPEFPLTVAGSRWPASDERAAAIRAAAQDISDWDCFLSVVKNHRVAVMVHRSLRAAAVKIPVAVDQELDAIAHNNICSALKLAAETVRVQGLLDAAGIRALVLKGVALEQLAYGSIAVKQTRDIDLLVPPEHAEAALQIIERDGYTLALPATKLSRIQRRALICFAREIELVNPRTKVRLELQWRASDNPLLLKGVDAHAATQTVTLSQGASVRTFASDDLFAYLCVHGAHHSWSRLKWLADLNALIASSKPDLEHLYGHAQAVGAGYCAGQALLLCQKLFGLQLPSVIADELETNKRCRRLVAIAMAAMTASNAAAEKEYGTRAVLRELRNQFLLGRGWAFHATQCRLTLVGVADIVRLPLPAPLHFIYPLVRLPLWLWRRAKLAVAPL